MVATIWRFRVQPDRTDAFERAYGPRGDWARLFERAEGYAGTELLKLHGEPATWLTIDRWRSEGDYERAKALLADDYAALDRRCEAYTCDEAWLGLHTVVE
ncbi:antibiotic biosynthesis monooxygenase family protein [Dokdonella sp.]|uniref:antibiotic biosynthesis monooxygenase family protein n=1 Tax=Dokdonella sp. TaxID=2291710 RepID=UPI002F4096E8